MQGSTFPLSSGPRRPHNRGVRFDSRVAHGIEIVHLCFEMMSLALLCLVSVPVLLFFCTYSRRTLRSQRQRACLLASMFAIPISFTAIIKSTISVVLKDLVQLSYAGISLAAIRLAYDMVLCFFDMPSFDKIVEDARIRNSNLHTRGPHHHNCLCSECTRIWPPPQVCHQDIHEDCGTTTTASTTNVDLKLSATSDDYELSEIVHGDVVTVLQDEQQVRCRGHYGRVWGCYRQTTGNLDYGF